MYTAGIPVGLLVDNRGPRPGALLGAVSIGVGYFSIYRGIKPPRAQARNSETFYSVRGRSWIDINTVVMSVCLLDGRRWLRCFRGLYQDVYALPCLLLRS